MKWAYALAIVGVLYVSAVDAAPIKPALAKIMAPMVPRLRNDVMTGSSVVVTKSGLVLTSGHAMLAGIRAFDRNRLLRGYELNPGEYAGTLELQVPYGLAENGATEQKRPELVSLSPSLVYVPDTQTLAAGFDFSILRLPLALPLHDPQGESESEASRGSEPWKYLPLAKTPLASRSRGLPVLHWGFPHDHGAQGTVFDIIQQSQLNLTRAIRDAHVHEMGLLKRLKGSRQSIRALEFAIRRLTAAEQEREGAMKRTRPSDALTFNKAEEQLGSDKRKQAESIVAKIRQLLAQAATADYADAMVLQFLSSEAITAINRPYQRLDGTALRIARHFLHEIGQLLQTAPGPDVAETQLNQIVERSGQLSHAFATLARFEPEGMLMLERWLDQRKNVGTAPLFKGLEMLNRLLTNIVGPSGLDGRFTGTAGNVVRSHSLPLESDRYGYDFIRPWKTGSVPVLRDKVSHDKTFSNGNSADHWSSLVEVNAQTAYGGSGGPIVVSDAQGLPLEVLGIVTGTALPNGIRQPRTVALTPEAIMRVLQLDGMGALARELMGAEMMP